MGTIAAFFDLDGTLCTEHLWRALSRYCHVHHRRRAIAYSYLIAHMALWPLHTTGILSKRRFFRMWASDLAWFVAGLTKEEASEVFCWVVDECIAPTFRPDVLKILHRHQSQEHLVVLVSGTLRDLLDVVGERLGVNHLVGTKLEAVGARYTGRVIEPLCFGQGKVELLRDFLSDDGLQVDFGSSFAYADSIFDVPMLELVGHPVAVYPSEELETYASQKGWCIVGGSDEARG